MEEARAVRSIRPAATEFAIVVAVMAVGTEDPCTERAPLRMSIQIPDKLQQAGLRQGTITVVHHGMTLPRRSVELRDKVQRVSGGSDPRRQVSEDGKNLFARTRTVTTQAGLELICCGI